MLIVVAIIGILAAIAVPNFLNAQTRAKASIASLESFFLLKDGNRWGGSSQPPPSLPHLGGGGFWLRQKERTYEKRSKSFADIRMLYEQNIIRQMDTGLWMVDGDDGGKGRAGYRKGRSGNSFRPSVVRTTPCHVIEPPFG